MADLTHLKIDIVVTVDREKAQGDEFELAVEAVSEAVDAFSLDATKVEVSAPDDLRVF